MTGDWRAYLQPQRELDALRTRALRAGGSRFVDLGYANAWDGPTEAVRAALHRAVDAEEALGLQYTPYGGSTVARRVAARAFTRTTGVELNFADVVLTPGAMSALSLVLGVLSEQGGNVVIPTPTWLDHPLYAAHQGLSPRLVPMKEPDFTLDFDAMAAAIDDETRAVVLTQPGNPTGTMHSAEALRRLGSLIESRDVLLVADECHRDYVFGGRPFESCVQYVPRTVTVYSYGKRLFAQGQRLGYAAVAPGVGRDFVDALVTRARATGIATPTALMQRALPDLEELTPDLELIAARRATAAARLRKAGFELARGEATMFLYVRAPSNDDWGFTRALAERGVLVCPAGLFHGRGWFRISLSVTDAMLQRGLDVLAKAASEVGGRLEVGT